MCRAIRSSRTIRLARGVLAVWSLACGAVACRVAVSPAFPADAVPMEPLAPYHTWWSLVETCSGLSGDFSDVRWYLSSGVADDGRTYSGAWVTDGNRIVLAAGHETDGGTVRHEMLHALVRRGGHPREYFVNRCGPLTPCERECGLTEATHGVPSTAAEILPEGLIVRVHVDPPVPLVHVDEGWFRITITATNPLPSPVWVRLPGPTAFSYAETLRPGQGTLTEEVRWAFLPNESRSYIFDDHYPAGTYSLYAAFGGRPAAPFNFTVLP